MRARRQIEAWVAAFQLNAWFWECVGRALHDDQIRANHLRVQPCFWRTLSATCLGTPMTDFDQFKQYYALADKLYEIMTPEQILETLRMLALHLADYRARFGIVERRDLLELVGATELTNEQTQLLKDGMQLLVGYLGAVRAGWDDDEAAIHSSRRDRSGWTTEGCDRDQEQRLLGAG